MGYFKTSVYINKQEMFTVMDLQWKPGRQENQRALTEICRNIKAVSSVIKCVIGVKETAVDGNISGVLQRNSCVFNCSTALCGCYNVFFWYPHVVIKQK